MPPDSKVAADMTPLLEQSAGQEGRIGLSDASRPEAELGIVVAGRLSPNGRVMALLDAVEPAVKIFDRKGNYLGGFGRADRDRGIFRNSPVLALSDSLVLVSDPSSDRMAAFGFDGRLLALIDSIPFDPLAATSMKNGMWLFYGPSKAPAEQSTASWLHCASLSGSRLAHVSSAYPAPASAKARYGGVQGIVRNGEGATVYDRYAKSPVMLHVECPLTGTISVTQEAVHATTPASQEGQRGGAFAGIGYVGEHVVLGRARAGSTELTALNVNGRSVAYRNTVLILDGPSGDALMLLVSNPMPHVLLVRDSLLNLTMLSSDTRYPRSGARE